MKDLSLHLFSERLRGAARWVKTDIIASLSLHAIIAEITALELSLSCLILCIIWFHQTTAQYIYTLGFLEWRAGYVFLKGCVSVTISYLSRWLTKIILSKIYKYINCKIYKVKQFYWKFGYIKIWYEHRETIRQNSFFPVNTFFHNV